MNSPQTPPPSAVHSPAPYDLAAAFQQALRAMELIIKEKPDSDKLLAEMVRLCGQALRAGGAGIWLTEQPDQPDLILEHNLAPLGLLEDNQPLPGLNLAVRRAVRENKPLIVPAFFNDHENNDLPVNPSQNELLFIPIHMRQKVSMVLVMAVPPTQEAGLHRTQIAFLQRMAAAVEATFTERHIGMIEQDRGQSNKIVIFAEQVHKHLFMDQVATDMANLSRDVIAADRVTVELYPRVGKKVLAVSNVDEPNRRSQLFQTQRLILDYVRDRHVAVILDRAAAKQLVSDPLLQDAAAGYFAASAFEAFVAAPVKNDQQVLGVMLAEFAHAEKAQQQSAVLSDLARICTTSVTNALEYESIPFRKSLHNLGQLWKKPTAKKNSLIATLSALAALLVILLCVIPFDFSIVSDCGVQPLAAVNIVAPADGQIIDVPTRAGDHIPPGGTLMVFDTTEKQGELSIQQQKLAQIQVQMDQEKDKAGSANIQEMAKIRDLQLQSEEVQYQIDLLKYQINQATVKSPIDATVLTERVEQQKWRHVKLGDPLLEVAKFSEWALVVDVPESDVALVRSALESASVKRPVQVEYILTPWPDKRFKVSVTDPRQLLPASQQGKTSNVFHLLVPVSVNDLPPRIQMSGVTGRARVHVGHATKFTQWTRGLFRLLRMTLFF